MHGFTPEDNHHPGKPGQRDGNLRSCAESFARSHCYLSSTVRGELWKNYLWGLAAAEAASPVRENFRSPAIGESNGRFHGFVAHFGRSENRDPSRENFFREFVNRSGVKPECMTGRSSGITFEQARMLADPDSVGYETAFNFANPRDFDGNLQQSAR